MLLLIVVVTLGAGLISPRANRTAAMRAAAISSAFLEPNHARSVCPGGHAGQTAGAKQNRGIACFERERRWSKWTKSNHEENCQLSASSLKRVAGTTGLEPAASAVTGQRSNQLNYVPTRQINEMRNNQCLCGLARFAYVAHIAHD